MYDIKKLKKALNIKHKKMHEILFWALIIYIYSKNSNDDPLLYKSTKKTSLNWFDTYK